MHVLIITGGSLDLLFAKDYIKTLSYDKVFAVDKGLEYVKQLELVPDCILGDFDTVGNDTLKEYEAAIEKNAIFSKILRFPPMKDASDTEIALQEAIDSGADCVTILGGTGTRLDHVLANLGILKLAEQNKICCYLVDANNRIQLLDSSCRKECIFKKAQQYGKYVSIILMSEEIKGLNMEGFLYPVSNMNLKQGSSLTVSNEISEQTATISLEQGAIWIIESKD